MRSYYAKQVNVVYCGGWNSVVMWARRAVKADPIPVQLLTARGGEKFARIIAEVSCDGERVVHHGRTIKLKVLRA